VPLLPCLSIGSSSGQLRRYLRHRHARKSDLVTLDGAMRSSTRGPEQTMGRHLGFLVGTGAQATCAASSRCPQPRHDDPVSAERGLKFARSSSSRRLRSVNALVDSARNLGNEACRIHRAARPLDSAACMKPPEQPGTHRRRMRARRGGTPGSELPCADHYPVSEPKLHLVQDFRPQGVFSSHVALRQPARARP